MSSEQTYFQSDGVQVTSTRVVMGGTTYALANITSVSMHKTPAKRSFGVILTLLGMAFLTYNGLGEGADPSVMQWGISIVVMLTGLLLVVMAKATYAVRFGSASGEQEAFSSKDQKMVVGMVDAINQAIIDRG